MNRVRSPNKVLASEFSEACARLSLALQRFGVSIPPTSGQLNLAEFSDQALIEATTHIEKEASRLTAEVIEPDYNRESEIQNLWAFLKENNYKFCRELFSELNKDQVIEVYDPAFKALYRNANFYRNTSYSIDELHLLPWPSLFNRETTVTNKIAFKVALAFESPVGSIIKFEVGPHKATELLSEKKLTALMQFDITAPIIKNDGTKAVITTLRIEKIGKNIS